MRGKRRHQNPYKKREDRSDDAAERKNGAVTVSFVNIIRKFIFANGDQALCDGVENADDEEINEGEVSDFRCKAKGEIA